MVFDENGKDLHMDKTKIRSFRDLDKDPIVYLTKAEKVKSEKDKHKIVHPKHSTRIISHGLFSILIALFFLVTAPNNYFVKAAIVTNFMAPVYSIIDFIVLNLVSRSKIPDACSSDSTKITNKSRWINAIFTTIACVYIFAAQFHPAITISSVIIASIQIEYSSKKWS